MYIQEDETQWSENRCIEHETFNMDVNTKIISLFTCEFEIRHISVFSGIHFVLLGLPKIGSLS